jgi:anti-sigma factor RsiW
MQPGFTDHITDDELEAYSLQRLAQERLAAVEEHLLVCSECRDRLEETDAYIRAIRSAAKRAAGREMPLRQARVGRIAWMAAAVSATLLMAAVVTRSPQKPPSPAQVMLEAVRGPMMAHTPAPPDRPLSLRMDLTDLPAHTVYRVVVVDERGRRVWDGAATPRDGSLMATVPKHLPTGRYYVRLYSPAEELLREYGIETAPR